MAGTTRIPKSILDFNTYINSTTTYLGQGSPETNATRLNILDSEQQAWTALNTAWEPLFPLYEAKRTSRTILVTDELHEIIDQLRAYDKEHHILDRIAASPNVTVTDLSVFNIKSGTLAKKGRSKPSSPIEALVVPEISQLGGGELKIKCHNNEDQRVAVVDGASCVEYRFLVGDEAPASVNDPLLQQSASTRASFALRLGAENSGKRAYLYFRWCNASYPELAGPWSGMTEVLIV